MKVCIKVHAVVVKQSLMDHYIRMETLYRFPVGIAYLRRMEESFFLPVTYKGEELQFEAKLEQRGYVYVLHVDVNGTPMVFERDEELNWRALLPQPELGAAKPPSLELLIAIGETIEALLK